MDAKYKPMDWVTFKLGSSSNFGQILGGQENGDGKGWMYYVSNPMGDKPYYVPSTDITHILMDNEWENSSVLG